MILTIDGHTIEAQPEQSLLNLIQQLGLGGGSLANRPLAAKIAGEVFTLNYIPVRAKDTQGYRPSQSPPAAVSVWIRKNPPRT